MRMVFDHQTEHGSQWATIMSIASKIGCTAETLRSWVRQAERDEGKRAGLTTVRKVWRQLTREGIAVARCTVARLRAAERRRGIMAATPRQ